MSLILAKNYQISWVWPEGASLSSSFPSYISSCSSSLYLKEDSFPEMDIVPLTNTPVTPITTKSMLYSRYPSLSFVIFYSDSIIHPASMGIKAMAIVCKNAMQAYAIP